MADATPDVVEEMIQTFVFSAVNPTFGKMTQRAQLCFLFVHTEYFLIATELLKVDICSSKCD
jgi:hypothetical protein